MKTIFETEEFQVNKFKYQNGRIGLKLVDKGDDFSKNITINPDWVKVVKDQIIVRNYGSTERIYDFLVQHKLVSKEKRDIKIGMNIAIACKILK